jgi:hypothetical protein
VDQTPSPAIYSRGLFHIHFAGGLSCGKIVIDLPHAKTQAAGVSSAGQRAFFSVKRLTFCDIFIDMEKFWMDCPQCCASEIV